LYLLGCRTAWFTNVIATNKQQRTAQEFIAMIGTAPRTTARAAHPSIVGRVGHTLALPFTHRFGSPLWLAIRLYLGYMWLMMGVQKIGAGWLTSDPVGALLKLVADGTMKVPVEGYRGVAQWLLDIGAAPLLSLSMPFLEIAVALAFLSGVLVVPAAIGAILLNINFMLTGMGQIGLDGRFIALQLLLILAFRVAGLIGFEKLALRILKGTIAAVRGRRRTVQSTS
jgi:thiosulfate dehydrogenase (quinone) large subunit